MENLSKICGGGFPLKKDNVRGCERRKTRGSFFENERFLKKEDYNHPKAAEG